LQDSKQTLIDLVSKEPKEMRQQQQQQQHVEDKAQGATIYPVVQLTTKVGLNPHC
jgi:type II secretory pathway component PulF